MQFCQAKNEASILNMLLELPNLKDFQYKKIEERIQLIKQLKDMTPLDALRAIRSSGYDKYYKLHESLSLQSQIILDLVQDVEEAASSFSSVEQFLNHIDELIAKSKSSIQNDIPQNAVSLMSIHSAKGLQFRCVFIIGCTEGNLPHKNATEINFNCTAPQDYQNNLDEECRLFYVAITRAQEELYISIPKYYHDQPTEVSRFLQPFLY